MTEPKITSAIKTPRGKNPGRVAARKRLAAISREAKERKKLEGENVIKESCSKKSNTSVVLAIGGLVVIGAVALSRDIIKRLRNLQRRSRRGMNVRLQEKTKC